MRSTAVIVLVAWCAVSWFAGVRRVAAQPAAAEPRSPPGERAADDEPQFRCKDHPGPVMVTFKAEAEVRDLIAWVMGLTCRSFLLDPRVVATGRKVSIIVPRPVTPGDAYHVFLAALASIGLTVVRRGDVLRIVEAAAARKEVLPLMKSGTPDDIEQFVRYVYKPSYIAAEPLHQAWQAIKSDAGEVFLVGSVLVMTDYASHVREMLAFARLIDVPGGSDGIYTLPVHHADAGKLADKLTSILGLASGGASPPRPGPADAGRLEAGKPETAAVPSKIIVDERTNTLILASGDAGYQRVKALVDRLDVALEIEGGSSIHVYPLGSAIADELAKTLTAAISDGRAARPPGGPGAAPPPAAPAAPGPRAPGAAPAAPPGPVLDGLGAALEGQVRVIADPPTNALIVMSSGRDFLAIKDVIKQLDLPRRQVYIEAVILEVDAGNDLTLGTAWHGGTQLGKDGAAVFSGVRTRDVNSITLLDSLQKVTGLFSGVLGPTLDGSPALFGQSIPSYAVLFQALAEQTHANIVSSPSIIAVDNVEAKYKVGMKIPVNKGTVLTPFGGGSAAQRNFELTEFPLKLDIKPHISSDDMVLLEVKHEADELTTETDQGPRSSTRSFETRVVVHDQETIVLGGLTQERDAATTTKVPVLGDLPLLGYLFKTTVRTRHKTNLLILLTPYVIKDRRDLQAIHERKLREHDEFARSFSGLAHAAYEPHVDYRKKRGLIEEINRAIEDVEQDAAARAAIRNAAPPGAEAGGVDVRPAPADQR
ncbi:MAG TPA: type II secretion system secretin GspD [Kofleriaceae bacterium]